MVDLASADAYASCVGFPPTIGSIWKKPRLRLGTLDYGLCPYGFFKCQDGHIAIACFRDQDFRAALKILGRWKLEEDWKSLLDRITDDIDKVKELNAEVEKAVAPYTYKEIAEKFSEYSVKAARFEMAGRRASGYDQDVDPQGGFGTGALAGAENVCQSEPSGLRSRHPAGDGKNVQDSLARQVDFREYR